jgi:hypothetical protein
MDNVNYPNCTNLGSLNIGCDAVLPQDFVWSTSLHAKLRALQVYMIRSVVERYGGSVHLDYSTGAIQIDVPINHQAACTREIQKQMDTVFL